MKVEDIKQEEEEAEADEEDDDDLDDMDQTSFFAVGNTFFFGLFYRHETGFMESACFLLLEIAIKKRFCSEFFLQISGK